MAPNLILRKCSQFWATDCSVSAGAYSGLSPDPAITSSLAQRCGSARASIAHLDLGKGKNSLGLGAPQKAFCLGESGSCFLLGFLGVISVHLFM